MNNNKYKVLAVGIFMMPILAGAVDLMHQFNSPAFSGVGYSSHVLTINQIEETKKKEIKAAEQAALDKAEAAKKNTNLSKFLNNVEARIYAQLSKQLADAMFADGAGTSGSMDFQGTQISWVKTGTEVMLTIIEPGGGRTEITVPMASFGF